MKRNYIFSLIAIALFLLVLTACGGEEDPQPTAAADTNGTTGETVEGVPQGQVADPTPVQPQATEIAAVEPTATQVADTSSGDNITDSSSDSGATSSSDSGEMTTDQSSTDGAGGISGQTTHTVMEREWMHQIARCYGTSPNDVVNANQLPHPGWIMAGEVWTIPNVGSVGPVFGPPCIMYHTVQQGETLYSVSRTYSVPVDVLTFVNYGCYGYNAHYDYGYYPPVVTPYDGGYAYDYYYDGYGYLGGCHYYSYPWLYVGDLLVIPVNAENMNMR